MVNVMGIARKTPEEALRISIDSLGGFKEVGHSLHPDEDPAIAGQWLCHTVTASRREKLSLSQIVLIFRRAANQGDHEGFTAFASACGYKAEPIDTIAELTEVRHAAEKAVRAARDAARDLMLLSENPELLARMKAAGLKVEGLT